MVGLGIVVDLVVHPDPDIMLVLDPLLLCLIKCTPFLHTNSTSFPSMCLP